MLISPFTNGIGLIVPLNEIFQQSLAKVIKKNESRKSDFNFSIFVFSLTSIFAAYILPSIINQQNLRSDTDFGAETVIDNNSKVGWVQSGIQRFRWLFVLVGSVLTPSNRLNPGIAGLTGVLIIIVFMVIVMKCTNHKEFANQMVRDSNCTLAGIIYVLGIIVSRGDLAYPLLWATSPRYVTGTIILCLGLVSAIFNSCTFSKKSSWIHIFLYLFLLICVALGVREGFIYQLMRHEQAKELLACIRLEDVREITGEDQERDCLDYAYRVSAYNVSKERFKVQLLTYKKIRDGSS
jgi:hypothetical protein